MTVVTSPGQMSDFSHSLTVPKTHSLHIVLTNCIFKSAKGNIFRYVIMAKNVKAES